MITVSQLVKEYDAKIDDLMNAVRDDVAEAVKP